MCKIVYREATLVLKCFAKLFCCKFFDLDNAELLSAFLSNAAAKVFSLKIKTFTELVTKCLTLTNTTR